MMTQRLISTLVIAATLSSITTAQPNSCSVCGDGKEVGNPDAIFEFSGQPSVQCGLLQQAGYAGQIPLSQCGFLASLIPMCECQAIETNIETPVPTTAPVTPTLTPVAPTAEPTVLPTTSAPVTPSPTTSAPVTPSPTTSAPVTTSPTTLSPVTSSPTTSAPVTPAPTSTPTNSPTISPTTAAPVMPEPTTVAPVTPKPTTSVPTTAPTAIPTTSAPITPKPTTSAPVTPEPTTSTPTTAPTTQAPVTPSPTAQAPVTADPTSTPTTVPTSTPTDSPTTQAPVTPSPTAQAPVTSGPTSSPTTAPTTVPTTAPTTVPTTAPTTQAPVTPSPTAQAPVTPEPTSSPTTAPTTQAPVTPSPTAQAPVTSGPTSSPTNAPSAVPTIAPTLPVTPEPTATPPVTPEPVDPTESPVDLTEGEEIDLKIEMTGMKPMSDETISIWETTTGKFVTDFYTETVSSKIKFISQNPPYNGRRLNRVRFLQSGDKLEVEFTQTLEYDSSIGSLSEVSLRPFEEGEDAYIQKLKESDGAAFADLKGTSVSNPNRSEQKLEKESMSLGLLIAIVVGGVVVLAIVLGGIFVYRRGKGHRKDYYGNLGEPPKSIKAGPDEVSTLAEPAHKGGMINPGGSIAEYGEESLATVDYDYEGAYGGAANHSVSSAGGTFGSNPQALGANQVIPPGALGSFDDGSFGDSGGANVREELIDIYAPSGKLGVVIDTPDDGAPVVHAIKDSSVIADKLQVGDKLVAVDDEDVRTMTAIKVSKLISRKSANPTRKLSIIRATLIDQ